ncbi:MAG: GGDEF domain-containing protein [Solirubrobacteraceae bacterium]|nr:GGDEF domain-containing protein [Solirubrobacteraceae bacterium]
MARPAKWGAAPPNDDDPVAAGPAQRPSRAARALNRAFLRFSDKFIAFHPASIEESDEQNVQIMRRVIAIGFGLGALVMASAVAFEPDRVGPAAVGWFGAALWATMAIACVTWRSMPAWFVRFLAFDATIVGLCLVVAIGDTPAYIALIFFGWPALTSAHFGRTGDFLRAWAEVIVLLPIALAFSRIPLPLLAYFAVLAVSGLSSVVIRAVVYQAKRLFTELDHIASTDALTGLLNRRAATTALEEAVARAHRQNTDLAVAIFDLDHFKRINDSFGHPAGDAALQRFSEVLRDTCSGTDVPARLGGEEFLVVLLRSDESGARAFAQRFSDSLDYATANDVAPLSVSAGVAALDAQRVDAEGLLVAADRALYAAKRSGRHQVVAASDAGVQPLGRPV